MYQRCLDRTDGQCNHACLKGSLEIAKYETNTKSNTSSKSARTIEHA
jgi:hypothetical protein